jgi:hypothetical protein
MCGAENIRALGHEVNAAENYELGVFLFSSPGGEFEGVSPEIRKADDLVPLVMMAKDYQPVSEPGANIANAPVRLAIGQLAETLR